MSVLLTRQAERSDVAAAVEGSIVVRHLGQLSNAVGAVLAHTSATEQWELRRRYAMSVITDIIAVELADRDDVLPIEAAVQIGSQSYFFDTVARCVTHKLLLFGIF